MFRNRMIVAALVLSSLLMGGLLGRSYGQTARPLFTAGHIFSGNDVGFRIDSMMLGKSAHATLLIKIDGEWREFAPTLEVVPVAK